MDTSETPTDQRPTWACLLHRPPTDGNTWVASDPGYRSCSPCLDRLRERLAEVAERYAQLDATPGASGEPGGRGAPGFGARSPASEHVLTMTDVRSARSGAKVWVGCDKRVHLESERPPVSVLGELDSLTTEIAEHRGVELPRPPRATPDPIHWPLCRLEWHDGRPAPAGGWPRIQLSWHRGRLVQLPKEVVPQPPSPSIVDTYCRWLDGQLDYVTRHEELAIETDAALRLLLAHLRPVTGDPRPSYIGHCPNPLDYAPDLGWAPAYEEDPGVPIAWCGARLYAPVKGDTIRCRNTECKAVWRRQDWLRLGDLLAVA